MKSGILDSIASRTTFVLIERSDKLGQAISYALAFATGRYTSYMTGTKNPGDIEFSKPLIDRILNGIAESNRQFDDFFGWNGIAPVNIVYEQLASDPSFFVRFIADRAGIGNLQIVKERLRLERQAGTVNARWRHI